MKIDNPEQMNDDAAQYHRHRAYMHDGRYQTLDAVIDHYDRGGDMTENQDPRIKPLGLSATERRI